ncbi:MAG: low temperature requirement protein A [Acidimicrobiales bacterium]
MSEQRSQRLFLKGFWQPPRAHGEIDRDRTVSFLELFYDLTYVVVIARAAHHLAEHVSWRGAAEFAVVFSLIWIAWLNGTLYYELHGREDGRTRMFVFLQMLILSLLAVFTGEATGEAGAEFAWTYVAFFVVLTYLWYSVRRIDPEEYRPITARYLTGMVISVAVLAVSSFLPDDARLIVWGAFVVLWGAGAMLIGKATERGGLTTGLTVTHSMTERFGLFTIIVLGEVIVGVVDGLSDAERTATVAVTGLLGLMIGFAFWWTFFDFAGRRLPRTAETNAWQTRWMLSHLPVTMSIAASGAAMVSLVEHASDSATPAASAWLLTGSVALGLVSMVVLFRTLDDYDRLPTLYGRASVSLPAAALVVLFLGWWAPAPWLLAAAVVVILGLTWVDVLRQWAMMSDPEIAYPNHPQSE